MQWFDLTKLKGNMFLTKTEISAQHLDMFKKGFLFRKKFERGSGGEIEAISVLFGVQRKRATRLTASINQNISAVRNCVVKQNHGRT